MDSSSGCTSTGTAQCCFEQLHKPGGDETSRAVTIRVVKIVEPVRRVFNGDTLPEQVPIPDMPAEGELLPTSRPGQKWWYDVDKHIDYSRILALLFENEQGAKGLRLSAADIW